MRQLEIQKQLNERYRLSMDEYDALFKENEMVKFGTKNIKLDLNLIPGALDIHRGKQRLVLQEIRDFHRKYGWIE